jgi:hypothetical protein
MAKSEGLAPLPKLSALIPDAHGPGVTAGGTRAGANKLAAAGDARLCSQCRTVPARQK